MRPLDIFLIDEMIEQYRRFNPMPDYNDGRPEHNDAMEAELMVTLLEELKALRTRATLYEIRISSLNRDKKNLLIENAELKRSIEEKK